MLRFKAIALGVALLAPLAVGCGKKNKVDPTVSQITWQPYNGKKLRIVVADFTNKSPYSGSGNSFGEVASRMLASSLTQSGHFEVYENATVKPLLEQQAFQNRRRTDYRNGNYTRWTNNWRNDRRYDWNNYRNHHRSAFRIGFYYDPFGWSYRPWSIGSYMYPSYYDQSFWLNDPWQYRLPPAYGPYRWVRYWDDALLVNIYTGQVEDVLHNFFW